MPDRQLEARFHEALNAVVRESKRLKYTPVEFIKMMAQRGGVQTARDLLDAKNPSSGFARLLELQRPDLSMEYVALQPEWAPLFTEAQLTEARARLAAIGMTNLPAPNTAPQSQVATASTRAESWAREDGPQIIERQRRLAEVLSRPEQANFRQRLRDRYGEGCQISGCRVMAVVQAAHIRPVARGGNDAADNGLLLRLDIHALFDAGLIGIDPQTMRVRVSSSLNETEYLNFEGVDVRVGPDKPNAKFMRERWKDFNL